MTDFEHYAYSLAWIAFREDSLLETMRQVEKQSGSASMLATLVDASNLAFGRIESGPRRRDLRPYIHRVGGPGDTASRLQRELSLGHVRARLAEGQILLTPADWKGELRIVFGQNGVMLLREPAGAPGDNCEVVECCIADVRARFDRMFSLHNFQGVWKPIPHADLEPSDPMPTIAGATNDVEQRAAQFLAQHLSCLELDARIAFRRRDAWALLDGMFGLSARGFNRVWVDARIRIGETPLAGAGRKRGAESKRTRRKSGH